MKNKHQKTSRTRLSAQTIRNVVIAIMLWFVFWLVSQYLFIGQWPAWLAAFMQEKTSEQIFIYVALWISLVAIIGTVIWHRTIRDYRFLKPINKKIYLAYILPAALLILLLIQPEHFGVRSPIYAAGLLVTVAWQDLLTFGFLQTYLSTQVSAKMAASITAVVFFAGHFVDMMTLPMLITYGLGFVIFAYLRYKTRSVHLTNVLHLSFVMLPM